MIAAKYKIEFTNKDGNGYGNRKHRSYHDNALQTTDRQITHKRILIAIIIYIIYELIYQTEYVALDLVLFKSFF